MGHKNSEEGIQSDENYTYALKWQLLTLITVLVSESAILDQKVRWFPNGEGDTLPIFM